MTTISAPSYAARVLDAGGDIILSLDENSAGDITLDASAIPHVSSSVPVAVEDAMQLVQLDPRDSRRVVLTASRDGGTPRTFDLGIREATPDRAGGTVTLTLASDEALVMDYAQLVDDNGPRAYQSSLRAVCEYVLSKVPGVQRNLIPYPTAGVGSGWGVASWGTGGAGTTNLSDLTGVSPNVPNSPQPAASFTWTTAPAGGVPTMFTGAFPIPTGRQLMTFSSHIASTIGGQQWRMAVQWFSDSALISTDYGPATAPTPTNWRFSVTARPPVGATRAAILWQLTSGAIVVGSFAWMSLAMAVVGTRTAYVARVLEPGTVDADATAIWGVKNLFPDPSVENATPAFAGDVGAPNVVRDGATYAPPYQGSYLLRVQATATTGLSIGQITPMGVSAGATYTASAYLRSASGNTKQARIIIRWTGPAGNFIRDEQSAYVMTSATAWTRYVLTARAPAGASGARVFIEWAGTHAAGNLHFVDGVMFHEGNEAIPLFTGSTPTDAYTYAWDKDVNASASTRTPTSVERLPESLLWRAGVSGMAFLEPLLKAAGLRLVCDEQRRWTLRAADFRAAGNQSYRYAVNIETADEKLSREDDAWYDAAVYVYTWTDSSGIEQTRTDAFALTTPPTKVLRVELRDTVYPGPGRAENIVRRAQGRGRTVTVSAIPTWDERTDQYLSILLEGTPIQTGLASTVRYDLADATVTVSARTVDTPAGAIDLLPGTINALSGTINAL